MKNLTAYLCILAAAQQRVRRLDRMNTMDAWGEAQPVRTRIAYLCSFISTLNQP